MISGDRNKRWSSFLPSQLSLYIFLSKIKTCRYRFAVLLVKKKLTVEIPVGFEEAIAYDSRGKYTQLIR